jgi:hypothetical protein
MTTKMKSVGKSFVAFAVATLVGLPACDGRNEATPSSKGGVSAPEMGPLIDRVSRLSEELASAKLELASQRAAAESCQRSNQELAAKLAAAELRASDAFARADQLKGSLEAAQVTSSRIETVLAVGTRRGVIMKSLGGPKRSFRLFQPAQFSEWQYLSYGKDFGKWDTWKSQGSAWMLEGSRELWGDVREGEKDNKRVKYREWQFDAEGIAVNVFVQNHAPKDLSAVAAAEWDGYLAFFDASDQLVYWCRTGK